MVLNLHPDKKISETLYMNLKDRFGIDMSLIDSNEPYRKSKGGSGELINDRRYDSAFNLDKVEPGIFTPITINEKWQPEEGVTKIAFKGSYVTRKPESVLEPSNLILYIQII